mmetsp:Transcript_26293/g.49960  ORF Transcript_26293/g.49960 Transcript_26293/m.49960 type:complete len:177 (-) Transcript_26293:108-638(-)
MNSMKQFCHPLSVSIAIVVFSFSCVPSTTSFSLPTAVQQHLLGQSHEAHKQHNHSQHHRLKSTTVLSAKESNTNTDNNNGGNARRNVLGLALPLTIALIANAPFIAVMSKPPTPVERETMLTEWCKGEQCTLLGGGAGYFDGATVDGVWDANLVMPSLEEYEEKARIAAELASTED